MVTYKDKVVSADFVVVKHRDNIPCPIPLFSLSLSRELGMIQELLNAPMIPFATSKPFEKLAVDLTGPSPLFDGKVIFTAIDYYSGYPYAYVLKDGSSREVITALRSIFSLFGFPDTVISDNGTTFTSEEFESFLSRLGVNHLYSAVYFPESNGRIERFHRTFKARLARLRESQQVNLQCAIDRVLFDIRGCPSSMSGETPFFRLFSRPMKNELSALSESSPTTAPRNVVKYYEEVNTRRNAKLVNFAPGDTVFARKGAGAKFDVPGEVVKSVGRGAWLIQTPAGDRVYNQSNLQLRYGNGYDGQDDFEDQEEAYDNAGDPEKKEDPAETSCDSCA